MMLERHLYAHVLAPLYAVIGEWRNLFVSGSGPRDDRRAWTISIDHTAYRSPSSSSLSSSRVIHNAPTMSYNRSPQPGAGAPLPPTSGPTSAQGGFAQPAPPQMGRVSPNPNVPSVSQNTIGQPGSIPAASSSSSLHPSGSGGIANQDKGPDYVYFERKPGQFGDATTGKATAAKMKLELYYKEAVEGVVGRKER